MTIDMTVQLAPLAWGMVGTLAVSALAIVTSYLSKASPRKKSVATAATPFPVRALPAAA